MTLQNRIYSVLQASSETSHLTNLKVYGHGGGVTLLGTVPSHDDLVRVYDLVREVDGVHLLKMMLSLEKRG